MGKVLKMEFRRLFKDGFFYAYPVILVVLMIIDVFTARPEKDEAVYVMVVLELAQKTLYISVIVAGILLISHCSDEDKHGYTKNYMGNIKGRHLIVISKCILGAVTMVIYSIFNFLYILVMYAVNAEKIVASNVTYYFPESADLMPEGMRHLWKSKEEIEDEARQALNHEIAHYILMVVAGIVTVILAILIYEIFKSAAFSYVMIILISLGIVEQLIIEITALVSKTFEIGKYLLNTQFMYIDGYMLQDETWSEAPSLWTFWVRNIIYLVLVMGAAIFVSKKKDAA